MSALPELAANLRTKVEQEYLSNPYTSGTSVSLNEALVIAAAVSAFKPQRTLEIGFAHAGSAAAVIAAKLHHDLSPTPHVALDPYQRSHSGSRGLEVIERLGYAKHLRHIEDWTEKYLPQAVEAGDQYDLIMIDGGHGMGQAVVDAYYSDRLLPVGGLILVDDIYHRSTAYSIEFLVAEAGYELIDCRPLPRNPVRLFKRSLRIGYGIAAALMSTSVDALAVLRKTREYRGGY